MVMRREIPLAVAIGIIVVVLLVIGVLFLSLARWN